MTARRSSSEVRSEFIESILTELNPSCQDGGVSSAPVLLWRRLTAEFLGSAFLAAVVIGAGIAPRSGCRLYPDVTPAEAAEVIVPHHGGAGRAPASAVRRNASLSADGSPGPAVRTDT
jgi:hypothetical protein